MHCPVAAWTVAYCTNISSIHYKHYCMCVVKVSSTLLVTSYVHVHVHVYMLVHVYLTLMTFLTSASGRAASGSEFEVVECVVFKHHKCCSLVCMRLTIQQHYYNVHLPKSLYINYQ